MKKLSYWEQFVSSGKVEDYLIFKQETEGKEEKNPYAGTSNCNRDDYKDGAYRGIR